MAVKILNIIYPADELIVEGTPIEVDLRCVDTNGKVRNKKLYSVLLHVTSLDPFEAEEVTDASLGTFWVDLFPVTKITDCDGSSIYVLDYKTDILTFMACCSSDEIEECQVVDFNFVPIIDAFDDYKICYE